MTKKINLKPISFLLAFVMLFAFVATPLSVFADPVPKVKPMVSDKKEDSYITVERVPETTQPVTEKYQTTRTGSGWNDTVKKDYKSVIRGDIFLEYDKSVDLEDTFMVRLKANKEFGFTINTAIGPVTVNPGESKPIPLEKNGKGQVHEITLNIPKGLEDRYEEGTYTIKLVHPGEMIELKMKIDVSNPKKWLAGTYNQPNYPAEPPKAQPEMAEKVKSAVAGFDTLSTEFVPFMVPVGTSAMDVLKEYAQKYKLNVTGMEKNYISRMGVKDYEQIGEFNINNYSGWMYTVNDSNPLDESQWYFPNVGAATKTFTKDASITWHFTMAYGADINANWGSPGGDPGMPTALRAYRLRKPMTLGDLVPQWKDAERAKTAVGAEIK